MRGVFVTGTGTGVGKTLVAAGLLKALRDAGAVALPMKPVQTGCPEEGGMLTASDLEFSIRMAGLKPDVQLLDLMCPFRYVPACSPHLAGRLSGIQPDVRTIRNKMERLSNSCDFLVAEGAGGVLVPLNENEKMLDLMVELNWPVILVARGDLGTINHSLLSLAVLRNAGLRIAAVVVNHLTEDASLVTEDNPGAIAKFGEVPLTMEIPYMPGVEGSVINTSFMRTMSVLAGKILELP
ncbi:MAG: dethiobiotin synthase [Candidatus Aegiribacteria sp.]|nr:dethiobiotin synthase [Candidatus Aegiribacteria sp.]